ncbi:hypothetical protein WTH01_14480 [Weissella thailandensis]|nr:hypothetical protein WTH01_14480 [Weissella thailandensis]
MCEFNIKKGTWRPVNIDGGGFSGIFESNVDEYSVATSYGGF